MEITMSEAIKNKRKRNPKRYGFHTFGDPGCPITFTGPFRDNIRVFLQECGEIEDFNVQGMPTWCTLLVNEKNGVVVPLYTIEESIKHSLRPFCDYCRCIGWSHHFVSKRRYHLIIPVDDEWHKVPNKSVFDLHTHLLHGLIHCNGFGHLLCINGLEGGSKFLCGREIMDLWDRICNALRTRKITVEDVSKKRSMDLRLLYGVAYGHPWFGRWGYKFCQGSFGVTEHKYITAIDMLSSINLNNIIEDFIKSGKDRNHIKQIIRIYREMSETQLITIRDLLRFMLVTHKSPSKPPNSVVKPITRSLQQQRSPLKDISNNIKQIKYKNFGSFAVEMASRWPVRRLEYAAEVIVGALKENGAGMSRQEVRDAARLHIGDTGLLDFVLKSINNLIVGNHVVLRATNPSTRILEFTIHEIGGDDVSKPNVTICVAAPTIHTSPAGLDVYQDVLYLYTQVLLGYSKCKSLTELTGLATQTVLDSKHFVKEWPLRDEEDELLRFLCRVMPSCVELETELTRPFLTSPGELVVVPLHATVGELKMAVECALRDTYCVLEKFVVRDLGGFEGVDDEEVLFGAVESGAQIWVLGSGVDVGNNDQLKYEGGADSWTVDCSCGARDDDGERMVACDICEVWQHTRCSGIDDAQAVPPLFLCARCSASLMPSRVENYCMEAEYA
ncbi:zinc finger protein [Macleaya cordata]|uniref:Zinc finger protein n=1 Tax=Macleaya cordata TaxID=56857 RepID=A0A200Q0S6_MACCD|nr:zinc finger protein [Macleaya cordata]